MLWLRSGALFSQEHKQRFGGICGWILAAATCSLSADAPCLWQEKRVIIMVTDGIRWILLYRAEPGSGGELVAGGLEQDAVSDRPGIHPLVAAAHPDRTCHRR